MFKLFCTAVCIIQFILASLISYFLGNHLEFMYVVASYLSLRYQFPKTYHAESLLKCTILTCIIFWTATIIVSVINIHISILINCLIGFIIGLALYYVRDYLDYKTSSLNKRQQIIAILDGNTAQEHIFELCRAHGLKEYIADTVDLFLNNTYEETASILNIDDRTVRRRVNLFIKATK